MKALLSVSFGTSHADTRAKTIDVIEARLRDEFPDRAFYSAWTSPRIIAKVKAERGEHHDTLDEALARIAADGADDLVVSTTCLMDGGEMAKIRGVVSEWRDARDVPVRLAEPLLSSARDRAAVARVLSDEFSSVGDGESDALLLMGHGSAQGNNEVYAQIQSELHALGRERFFVATVEGTPTFEDAWRDVTACGAARVHLAPLMIVAGDHATNDLAGDGEDSWAGKASARGLQAIPVLKGLGEYVGIQQLVCDHVRDAQAVQGVPERG